jgi:nucleotide-binding universal stress UspA family protein
MSPVNGDRPDTGLSSGGSGGEGSRQQILYPIFDTHDEETFELALEIAEGADAELPVIDLVETSDFVDESRSVGSSLLRTHVDPNRNIEPRLLFEETTDPVKTVNKVAELHDVDLVVFDQHTPESITGLIRGDAADRVTKAVSCDAVTVASQSTETQIGSILVPIAEGPHSETAVTVAGAIARTAEAPLELLHVSGADDPDSASRVEELFAVHRELLPADVTAETWHLEEACVASTIIEQSRYYGITVIGKPRKSRLRRFVAGSVTDDVSQNAENTVLVTQRGSGTGFRI